MIYLNTARLTAGYKLFNGYVVDAFDAREYNGIQDEINELRKTGFNQDRLKHLENHSHKLIATGFLTIMN